MGRDEINEMCKLQQAYDLEMSRANSDSAEGLSHYVLAAMAQTKLYRMSSGLSAEIHKKEALRLIGFIREGMSALGIHNSEAFSLQRESSDDKHELNPVRESNESGENKERKEPRSIEEVLSELDELVGLESVKKDVKELVAWVKTTLLRKERGLPVIDPSFHMVFTGNPGTGKTTVARLIGEIYHSVGLLRLGHLVEVDRSGMVGQYQGHTEKKVEELVDKSLGGILFIDEAYALAQGQKEGDFGMIAINTLLKAMEDHRGDLIVVAAGYAEPMKKFIKSNPGLTSRFTRYFHFEDYNPSELVRIFELQCKKGAYQIDESDGSKEYLLNYFTKLYENRDNTFGNGRLARNLFEKVLMKQSIRLNTIEKDSIDSDLLTHLIIDDFRKAVEDNKAE